MKVRYLNNEGEGFAGVKEIEEGTTLSRFFETQTNNGEPTRYAIRVNNDVCESSYILKEGDRITVSPKNISGA